MLCDYCCKRFPTGFEVRWGTNRLINKYCEKCLPEVEANMRSSYLYKGHTVKHYEDQKER